MSANDPERTPKIDRPTLERIGRELRGLYVNVSDEPPSPTLQLALKRIEDADHGLAQLKAAAQALRAADEAKTAKPRTAVAAPLAILRRLQGRRPF